MKESRIVQADFYAHFPRHEYDVTIECVDRLEIVRWRNRRELEGSSRLYLLLTPIYPLTIGAACRCGQNEASVTLSCLNIMPRISDAIKRILVQLDIVVEP